MLDYATPEPRRGRVWPLIILSVVAGLLLVAIGYSLLVPRLGSRPTANRVKCQSNLRQIGQALLIYANEHGGQYPDSFQTVLATEEISPEVFCCPSGSEDKASGPTTQAMLSEFVSGKHCSYVYVARGATPASSPDIIVAYEPLGNHAHDSEGNSDGMNVLFNDGHAEFISKSDAQALLKKINSTTQPVSITVK